MRFSILIPAYNVEKYISECLDSVLKQEFDDYEIIIINDGSTDSTLEICKKFESSRIHIFNQENKGLLLARRAAIEKAKGEYCINLDSDDKLVVNALSTIDSYIEEYNADIVIYNLSYFDDKNQRGRLRPPVFDKIRLFEGDEKTEIYHRILTTFNLNSLVLKAIKTELLKSDNTDYIAIGNNSMGEDLLQSLYPITYAKRILYTPDSFYMYRKNEQSMTRIIDRSNISSCLKKYNPCLVPMKVKYLEMWKLDNHDSIKKLIYAESIRELIQLYKHTFENIDNRDIICFASLKWEELLPNDIMSQWKNLPLSFYEKIQFREMIARRTFLFRMIKLVKGLIKVD